MSATTESPPVGAGLLPVAVATLTKQSQFTPASATSQAPKPTALPAIPEQMPDALTAIPQWVVWKLSWKAKEGKWDKVPFDAKSGVAADYTNPKAWAAFAVALAAYQKGSPHYDGIGFVATRETGLVFGDFDDAYEGDELKPLVAEVLERCVTYAERSPSGQGVRVIGYGAKPRGLTNNPAGGIEIYDDKKYLTITGQWLKSTPDTIEPVDFGFLVPAQKTGARAIDYTPKLYELLQEGKPAAEGQRQNAAISLAGKYKSLLLDELTAVGKMYYDRGQFAGHEWGYIEAALERGWKKYHEDAKGAVSRVPTLTTWASHAATLGEIQWLWDKWLPSGLLSMLVAKPEIGKSAYSLAIAASFTDGRPLPDGSYPKTTGRVVWVDTESSQVLNYGRARQWGVDMEKFIEPTLDNEDEDIALDSPEGWASMEAAARLDDVVLIVVDSLGGAVMRENDEVMKAFVQRLAKLSRDTGKAILLIHHPRKQQMGETDEMTLDKIRGFSAIAQFARVIWTIEIPDPYSEDKRRVRVLKSNIGLKPKALGFEITEDGIAFGAAPEKPEQASKVEEAKRLIRELLKDGKPKEASIFTARAKEKEIGQSALSDAKKALKVVSKKSPEGPWLWHLPAKALAP